ncbi:hypothetical protein BH10PLA2_BH10PLA2_26390 [soil metagenome]
MPSPDDVVLLKSLRILQIITSALLLGVIVFTTVVVVLVANRNNGAAGAAAGNPPLAGGAPADKTPIISFVAILMFATQVPLSFVVPGMQTREGLKKIAAETWSTPRGSNPAEFKTDAPKLLALRQTTLITSLAILEGAGFFAGVAYLLEMRPFVLAVVAVIVLQMLMNFPTEYRVRTWLETQADRLTLLRQQREVGEV